MASPPVIEIVSATRLTESAFASSPLGVSLARMERDPRLVARIAFENRLGLPEIYNTRIASADPADVLVFIHDDVWIEDFFFADRLLNGLSQFDVLGAVGTSRRQPGQFMWALSPLTGEPDFPHLRGALAHGEAPLGPVNFYGQNPGECELLDGVFLAARKTTLVKRAIAFDPQFDFHFYDLDFCRTARRAGLRLGVWPISMTHRSLGGFERTAFGAMRQKYLTKWPD
jgi:GT2 family glycosyltransferase